MRAVLALDQGTTSSRAILFDREGRILGVQQKEFRQHFPQSGWVEHDAMEIWESQLSVARGVFETSGVSPAEVAAIGLTNQRETTVIWDRKSGRPIHHAIVWQDRRTAPDCDRIRELGKADWLSLKTGLVLDAYFSATKIQWLLKNIPGARQKAERGELAFGTIDSWLLWNLSGGKLHITDPSNASRTLLMNLNTLDWDQELLDFFDIPKSIMPEIRDTSEIYGCTDPEFFGREIALAGAAGDQQSALFGQNCSKPAMAKNTYGTGCFMLMNIGQSPTLSKKRLLTSVAWRSLDEVNYALEGSVFIAGAAVQWLRDGLGIISSSSEVEALASKVQDSDDLYLVPAFAGLGAPHWDAYARGTIVGITRGTTAAHLARAALEGIAFQVADVLTAMQSDSGVRIQELRVDGGACANNLLMQFQADILQTPVVRPMIIETTALGAAFFAGLAVGFWSDVSSIERIWKTDRIFEPKMSADEACSRHARWGQALERAKSWEPSE